MDKQELEPLDIESTFSKNVIDAFFNSTSMKKRKRAMDKNNYSKLKKTIVDADTKMINNCLLYAIHYNKTKIAKKIIETDYDINAPNRQSLNINENNSEIFRFAVYYNRLSLIEPLINAGADVTTDENYALIKYCLANNTKIIRLLIKNGANVYARNCLALIQAAGIGNMETFLILIEHMNVRPIELDNASVLSEPSVIYTNYDIALISAAMYNNVEIVNILIQKGANPTVNNSEILINAVEKNFMQIVQILLDYGVNPNIRNGQVLKTVINNGNYSLTKFLVEYKFNGKYVCDLSFDDSIYLRWAAIKGDYDICKLLLESVDIDGRHRCDVNAADNDAYNMAQKYQYYRVAQLLEYHQKIKKID